MASRRPWLLRPPCRRSAAVVARRRRGLADRHREFLARSSGHAAPFVGLLAARCTGRSTSGRSFGREESHISVVASGATELVGDGARAQSSSRAGRAARGGDPAMPAPPCRRATRGARAPRDVLGRPGAPPRPGANTACGASISPATGPTRDCRAPSKARSSAGIGRRQRSGGSEVSQRLPTAFASL